MSQLKEALPPVIFWDEIGEETAAAEHAAAPTEEVAAEHEEELRSATAVEAETDGTKVPESSSELLDVPAVSKHLYFDPDGNGRIQTGMWFVDQPGKSIDPNVYPAVSDPKNKQMLIQTVDGKYQLILGREIIDINATLKNKRKEGVGLDDGENFPVITLSEPVQLKTATADVYSIITINPEEDQYKADSETAEEIKSSDIYAYGGLNPIEVFAMAAKYPEAVTTDDPNELRRNPKQYFDWKLYNQLRAGKNEPKNTSAPEDTEEPGENVTAAMPAIADMASEPAPEDKNHAVQEENIKGIRVTQAAVAFEGLKKFGRLLKEIKNDPKKRQELIDEAKKRISNSVKNYAPQIRGRKESGKKKAGKEKRNQRLIRLGAAAIVGSALIAGFISKAYANSKGHSIGLDTHPSNILAPGLSPFSTARLATHHANELLKSAADTVPAVKSAAVHAANLVGKYVLRPGDNPWTAGVHALQAHGVIHPSLAAERAEDIRIMHLNHLNAVTSTELPVGDTLLT